jgi:AhpD family alkylhydroperoxidase
MAHVAVVEGRPGIVGLLEGYPETGVLLNGLAQALLRTTDGLSPAERELIAAYVSSLNRCVFCTSSHAAAARHLLGDAATVCMYNRYVDGLATWAPDDPAAYDEIGAHLAAHGYGG